MTCSEQAAVNLTGYTDRLSVRPGEKIGFHVHAVAEEFEAKLVRLRHGDENPKGPGFREIEVPSAADGKYRGGARTIRPGSCGAVAIASPLSAETLTAALWIWPTMPQKSNQGLIAGFGTDGEALFELRLGKSGIVDLRIDGDVVATGRSPLHAREWYFVLATIDRRSGRARLQINRQRFTSAGPVAFAADGFIVGEADHTSKSLSRIIFGATTFADGIGGLTPRHVFNGKLAAPCLFSRCLEAGEIYLAARGQLPTDADAAWDFSREYGSTRLLDVGPNGWHGTTHNRPSRLMVGPFWNGEPGPSERHDAIHFHEDDTADVGWPESLALVVPDALPSGVYALRIRAGGQEDHLPFFVLPPRGQATNAIAVLFPVLSYLAYANESLDPVETAALNPLYDEDLRADEHRYIAAHGLKSTYDLHVDRSGICHSSVRRPNFDFRPRARSRICAAPRQFPADLYLVDWLEELGFGFDAITDFDLHADGADLLKSYRVVLTGSHPEYWSEQMISARDGFLEDGGRLMYLGGDGFYWSTAVSADEGGLIEVRRFTGVRTWQAQPGEFCLSLSGKMGGIWRDHGKAPQKSVGVGFSGQGFDRGAGYRRTAASYLPAYAHVFEDVSGPIIGAGPSLTLNFGAAGLEVDAASADLGTPAHAVVLASSEPFSDAYQLVIEETLLNTPWSGGRDNPNLRADIVLLQHPNGGAVFSVGSIGWTATLFSRGYLSDTSRITANVLRAFLR